MNELGEAWTWYEHSRSSSRLIKRLGPYHWDGLPWQSSLGKDEELRIYEAIVLVTFSTTGLGSLDQLAVLALFSAFESRIRLMLVSDLEFERSRLRNPFLKNAAGRAVKDISTGSFLQVLERHKALDKDLAEAVIQVLRYRNRVAHGRNDESPPVVDPRTAYVRLSQFLTLVKDSPGPKPDDYVI